MKKGKIDFLYREYLPDELKESDKLLISSAINAAKSAYAPYSGFRVGVAAKLTNGEIITGNNQENAAYPSGLCAERVALFYIQAKHPGQAVKDLVITAVIKGKQTVDPVYPCGACRQVILEHESRHDSSLRMLFAGSQKVIEVSSASMLLPLNFTSKDLKKKK